MGEDETIVLAKVERWICVCDACVCVCWDGGGGGGGGGGEWELGRISGN